MSTVVARPQSLPAKAPRSALQSWGSDANLNIVTQALLEVVRLTCEEGFDIGSLLINCSSADLFKAATHIQHRLEAKASGRHRERERVQPVQNEESTSHSWKLIPGGPCESCHVTEAPQWRRPEPARQLLCNRCGIHYKRYKKLPGPKELVTPRVPAAAAALAAVQSHPPATPAKRKADAIEPQDSQDLDAAVPAGAGSPVHSDADLVIGARHVVGRRKGRKRRAFPMMQPIIPATEASPSSSPITMSHHVLGNSAASNDSAAASGLSSPADDASTDTAFRVLPTPHSTATSVAEPLPALPAPGTVHAMAYIVLPNSSAKAMELMSASDEVEGVVVPACEQVVHIPRVSSKGPGLRGGRSSMPSDNLLTLSLS